MPRNTFGATPADRVKIQVVNDDDLPERVTVDLDDKDPNNFTVVEVDDQTDEEKLGTKRDPAEWGDKNAADPKGVTPRVQKRFDRLKAETETERRIRLETERQRDEAVRVAQNQKAEIDDLRRRLNDSNTTTATAMKGEWEAKSADARRRLEQAHAEGNSADIAAATADLTRAETALVQISAATPRQATPAERQPEPQRQPAVQQPPPQLSPNVAGWLAQNQSWWTRDQAKTDFALSLHRAIIARGISDRSDDYTRELDKGMKAMYPDHQPYSGSRSDEDDVEERTTAPRRTNAVAPGSRENGAAAPVQANPRTVELTSSQLAIAKQLGLSPQQYAASLVKYNANRRGA